MVDKAKEQLKTAPKASEIKEEKKHIEHHKEVRETAEGVLKAEEVLEGVEAQGTAETVETGKVSEVAGEDKKKAPAGGGAAARTDEEIAVLRAKLLAALPPQEIMVKEIKKKLRIEEKQTKRKMRKFQKAGHKAAYQLNIAVAKLRQIRAYFQMLAHATFEIVKNLWLKIVHGV